MDALSFSPDGKTFATGGDDSVVRFASTHTNRLAQAVPYELPCFVRWMDGLSFSPDGETFATGGDNTWRADRWGCCSLGPTVHE